ncbi:hypothetical protein BHM03_00005147 [Ensete ventricosum]|nr:hypothetical protein BHM03_00005147 [Ensete ventricosum]
MQATLDDHEPSPNKIKPEPMDDSPLRVGQQSLTGWLMAVAPYRRAEGCRLLRAVALQPWPWSATPTSGLVMAYHPYRWPGRGWPPLQGVWPWSVALAEGLAIANRPLSMLLSLRKRNKNA